MMARSRCRAAKRNHTERSLFSHETGPTGIPAVCLCPAAYLGGDRRAAHRATGLPGTPYVLRKGELSMQHRFPVEVPLLLDRVQVTRRCLRQAHEQLGASLLVFEDDALIQPRHCQQAIKTVRTMGELAASLHAYLLTQDAPTSLTVGLRLRLSLLKHYTEKTAMQLVLLQSCCRRHTAVTQWLHQQVCAYLDAVMELTVETLRELLRFVTQVRRAASDDQQASLEGAGSDDRTSTTRAPAQHA